VVRFVLRILRAYGGRAIAAWCVALALALGAGAQELDLEGPPPDAELMFDGGEDATVVVDDGSAEGETDDVEFGPQVGYGGGAPFDYVQDQGLPYIMQQEGGAVQPGMFADPSRTLPPPDTYCPCMTRLGFRHSYTHGRNVGWGGPLVGTSWLNRTKYVGFTLGPMWFTNRVAPNVGRDTDVMGSVFYGWDWDYYWGSEFQYAYATPELVNETRRDVPPSGRLVSWNYSFMYYPWGDSNLRPYWRFGVGDSHFDFPTDAGTRWDEWLYTIPFGVGVKYPLRRFLAARIEFVDQYSIGGHGAASQHNLTLNFGLEYRFGSKKKAYWPWNPESRVW
jgi:hypothetical protein